MSFLAPGLLWLLPLALLPVVIHLLNRMRHRTVRWGAMMFLLAATRESTRHARLRQWLILACRCLALAALLLALARPLVGSWFGGGGPELVLVIADRSASMERRVPGQDRSLREALLAAAQERLSGAGLGVRLAVLDTAEARTPSDVADASHLADLAGRGPTGTTADWPSLFGTVTRWLEEQRTGASEVWMLTDLQRSNFRPDTGNWAGVVEQLVSLPSGVRARVLTQLVEGDDNRALRLLGVVRREKASGSDLEVTVGVVREGEEPERVPVALGLNGAMGEEIWELFGRESIHRWTVSFEDKGGSGWGEIRLPPDANPEDNAVFFSYGPVQPLAAVVRAEDASAGQVLGLAVAPAPGKLARAVDMAGADVWSSALLAGKAMVIWQGAMPSGEAAGQLEAFVREGGTALVLPGEERGGSWLGVRWGAVQRAETEPMMVARWNQSDGLLANTSGGARLPVDRIALYRWCSVEGAADSAAWLADGSVWLARLALGRGQIWWCGTIPVRSWSDLGESAVLVPMVQRLLEAGSARVAETGMFRCGESLGVSGGGGWERMAGEEDGGAPGVRAGVWRAGDRLAVFNRPDEENDPVRLGTAEIAELLRPLPVGWDQSAAEAGGAREVELWRWLVALAALALAAEAALTLPGGSVSRVGPTPETEKTSLMEREKAGVGA